MSKPLIHARSSARKYGSTFEDYLEIHEFMDSSKAVTSLPSHRALTHNTWFVSTVLTRVFGEVFKRKSDGKLISTRDIGEQHIAVINNVQAYFYDFMRPVEEMGAMGYCEEEDMVYHIGGIPER